jgi:hypothetical protein
MHPSMARIRSTPAGEVDIPPRVQLPEPPEALLERWEIPLFRRSEEMEEFVRTHWIEGATFPNEPFQHLEAARVGVLWAGTQAKKGGSYPPRMTAGMAEIFEPRPAKRWVMDRQSAYMHQLFGFELPDFVLTFDAQWWAAETVSVATKLGVVTHELCHCGVARDEDGEPKLARVGPRKGEPIWSIVPHDVEQFDLPVEWFGAEAAGITSMIKAAARGATMRDVVQRVFGGSIGDIEPFPCATCGRKVA